MAKTTLKVVSPETLAKVRKRLKALPKVEPKKLTKSEAIREMSDVIEELRESKGYSYDAIAAEMKKAGLDVSGRSVQIALTKAGASEDDRGGSDGSEG